MLTSSLVAGALLVALQIFEWNLVDLLTPFVAPLLALPVLGLFILISLGALVEGVTGLWRRQPRRLQPLGVCLAAFGIAFGVPWTDVMLDVDFRLHRRAREEVVRMVHAEELKPDARFGTGLIQLPERYRHLSSGGGEIVLDGFDVLFYTYRGTLDNFSGFVYSPSGEPPPPQKFGGVLRKVTRKDAHWFWVSAS